MPINEDCGDTFKKMTWKTMNYVERKQWYRDNQFRKHPKKP